MTSDSEQTVVSIIKQLGAAVRARRRRLGLTQQQAAELAGISVNLLSEIEAGKASVHFCKLLAILHALGLQLNVADGRDIIKISEEYLR